MRKKENIFGFENLSGSHSKKVVFEFLAATISRKGEKSEATMKIVGFMKIFVIRSMGNQERKYMKQSELF